MKILHIIIPIYGLFVGSFLNSCIDRLPRHKSLTLLHSFCPSCEKPLKLYARIPLFGYILSKGKCTQCGAPLSLRYPGMEIVAAFVCYFLFRQYGISVEFFVKTSFVLLLVAISFIDVDSGMIPDILAVGGLSLGFVLAFFRRPLFFYQDALYGIIACGGILFAIAFCCRKFVNQEIMASGDIKLLSMIGAFCGLKGALFSLVTGSLFGVIVGSIVMLTKGRGVRYAIPFAPFLSFGALFFMFFGGRFMYGFFRFVSGG